VVSPTRDVSVATAATSAHSVLLVRNGQAEDRFYDLRRVYLFINELRKLAEDLRGEMGISFAVWVVFTDML